MSDRSALMLNGMARAVWMVAYASSEAHADEAEKTTVDSHLDDGWVPATPVIAKKAARDLYELFEVVNKRPLDKLYNDELKNFRAEGADAQDIARAHMGAYAYGWYMAMAALGNASWFTWFDDLTVETAVPTFEADVFTENRTDHLNWEGSDKVRLTISNAFTHADWKKKNPGEAWPRSGVQTLLFPVAAYSTAQAKAWATEHGFKASKVDTTEQFHRLRQFAPDGRPCRTITFHKADGIEAVVCAVGKPPGVP